MDCRNSGTQSFSSVMMTRTWCTWERRKAIEILWWCRVKEDRGKKQQTKKNTKHLQSVTRVLWLTMGCIWSMTQWIMQISRKWDEKKKGAMGWHYKVLVKVTDCVEDRGRGNTQEGFGGNCPNFLPLTGSYFG